MALSVRLVIGSLLVVHGFAHWHLTSGWNPTQPDRSWLLSQLAVDQPTVHALATLLWTAALLAFLCAGGALYAGMAAWRWLAVASAAVSLVAMIAFWRAGLVVGAAVDVGVLAALLWIRWPVADALGG